MPEPNLDFGEWDVESLRVSIFHPTSVLHRPSRTDLWNKVTSLEPESIDSRPREGVTRAIGGIGGNSLILSIQEGRLDWLVHPMAVVPNQRKGAPLTLKDVRDVLPILQRAIGCSLETVSPIQRLAFAPVLVKQAPDLTLALSHLSGYLPRLNLDGLDGFDFVYQINRRRQSASVRHARVNRIAKWSTGEVGSVDIQMRPSGTPLVQTTAVGFIRKLELDVNTTPETGAMSNDKIPILFDELVTLAIELATDGDVS